jgi:hypothetical protein
MRTKFDMLHALLDACAEAPKSKKQLVHVTRLKPKRVDWFLARLCKKGVLHADWQFQTKGNRGYYTFTLSQFGESIHKICHEMERLLSSGDTSP